MLRQPSFRILMAVYKPVVRNMMLVNALLNFELQTFWGCSFTGQIWSSAVVCHFAMGAFQFLDVFHWSINFGLAPVQASVRHHNERSMFSL